MTKKGNATKVNEIQIKINELYEIIQVSGGKVIPAIKTGVALLGRSTNWMKISSQTLSKQEVEKVKIVLRNLNLINTK